jgi:hypothetical protein
MFTNLTKGSTMTTFTVRHLPASYVVVLSNGTDEYVVNIHATLAEAETTKATWEKLSGEVA